MQEEQSIIYEEESDVESVMVGRMDDEVGGQHRQSFTNEAKLRQVNFVQDTTVNINYSKFDKLKFLHETA